MKKLQIKHLNEKDEEIVEALISLGMNRPVAPLKFEFFNFPYYDFTIVKLYKKIFL